MPELRHFDHTIALGQFPQHPSSAGDARRFVTSACANLVTPDTLDSIALLVSELVTNAVIHAKSRAAVQVTRGDKQLVVAVSDSGHGAPILRRRDLDEPNGRGLNIVNLLAASWGVQWTGGAKTVWFAICCH